MFCQYCGTENAEGTKFCTNCGASLVAATTHNTYEQPAGAQPNYNQPNYNQYANYNPAPASEAGKGFAIAGLVLGIIAILCQGWLWGVLAIIFACVARSKGYKKGMSTAGIVCGIIGIILSVLTLIGMMALFGY